MLSNLSDICDFSDLKNKFLPHFEQDVVLLFEHTPLPEPLKQACVYAMGQGGKRLRPLFVMAAFVAHQGTDFAMARRAALAVELLHGYSLIHDDLPCMDDDALRRGKPTCHKVFGEAVALLAGDVLQALSFEVLSAPLPNWSCDFGMAARLGHVFAPRARRMVAGQMLDMMGEQCVLDEAGLQAIHSDKTGALIEAALLMGAVCAGADRLDGLQNFAKQLGLAYQVQDDVLDATATTQTLGKTAGRDADLQKSTYVSLLGTQSAHNYAQSLYQNAKAQVQEPLLTSLVDWVESRQY